MKSLSVGLNTAESRLWRGFARLPLTSKLDALCAANANRILPTAETQSEEGVAPPDHEKSTPIGVHRGLEAPPGIGPGNKGFADLCLTTWLCRHQWSNPIGFDVY